MRKAVLAVVASVALALASTSTAHAANPLPLPDIVQPIVADWVRNVQMPSVQNARDLGGLRGRRGFIPHGQFYRAATLVNASNEDRGVLLGRGITLDIDLRSFLEAQQRGDRLSSDTRFAYRRISLLGVGISDWFRAGNLPALYLHTLEEHQSSFRDVFSAMATHQNGAVLYHCTSGKDRTGMVTAILLDLAGVEHDTIVRDYAISAHYLGRGADSSPPAAIAKFLDLLQSKYGGARAYLSHIGLPEVQIRALLTKLGQA